ncbi:MAG TPA: hypothetical protein VKV17_12840 [Bryobacteraceae bacterium]|nr:hypothetical protein [Bryobacteraceae bacterium]
MQIQIPNVNGLVLFSGGRNPFRAGPGFLLTDLIAKITGSPWTHSAIKVGPGIFESTIKNGVSGPQYNPFDADLEEYLKEGGRVDVFEFLPQFEPDWDALERAAWQMISLRMQGKLPYNVERLFGDAVQRSPIFDVVALPADGVITYLAAHSKGVVCSEMAAILMEAGGVRGKAVAAGVPWLPNVRPPAQPIGCAPADLAAMALYKPPVGLPLVKILDRGKNLCTSVTE